MDLTRDRVLSALCRHVGAQYGVSAGRLVVEICGHTSTAAERRLRELITQLRLEGYHICAHPRTGYFIAETAAELDATCQFLYERAMASLSQIAQMKRVSLPDLRGQLKLPT